MTPQLTAAVQVVGEPAVHPAARSANGLHVWSSNTDVRVKPVCIELELCRSS